MVCSVLGHPFASFKFLRMAWSVPNVAVRASMRIDILVQYSSKERKLSGGVAVLVICYLNIPDVDGKILAGAHAAYDRSLS